MSQAADGDNDGRDIRNLHHHDERDRTQPSFKKPSLALIDRMCRRRTTSIALFCRRSRKAPIRNTSCWSLSVVCHFCGLMHRLVSELKLFFTSTLCHSVRHAGQLSTPSRRSIGHNWWVQVAVIGAVRASVIFTRCAFANAIPILQLCRRIHRKRSQ